MFFLKVHKKLHLWKTCCGFQASFHDYVCFIVHVLFKYLPLWFSVQIIYSLLTLGFWNPCCCTCEHTWIPCTSLPSCNAPRLRSARLTRTPSCPRAAVSAHLLPNVQCLCQPFISQFIMYIKLRWVSYSTHAAGSWIFIHPSTPCLLNREFNLFTFHGISWRSEDTPPRCSARSSHRAAHLLLSSSRYDWIIPL